MAVVEWINDSFARIVCKSKPSHLSTAGKQGKEEVNETFQAIWIFIVLDTK